MEGRTSNQWTEAAEGIDTILARPRTRNVRRGLGFRFKGAIRDGAE